MSNGPDSAKRSHRDGKFSDVIEDPDHHQHPKTDFDYPEELPDETLAWEMQRGASALCAAARAPSERPERMTREAVLFQLRKVFDLLALYFPVLADGHQGESRGTTAQSSNAIELSEILDFIWNAGPDGIAQARPDAALMRCGVVSWFLQPALFDDANQKDFGILLREKASMRCPNCAQRKKEIENTLRRPSPAFHLRDYRGHWLDSEFLRAELATIETHYLTTEMKKQSPNRIVTEMRDRWPGLKNGHMRSEKARENFREREAAKGVSTRALAHGHKEKGGE